MKITFVNSDFVKSEGLWVAGFFPPPPSFHSCISAWDDFNGRTSETFVVIVRNFLIIATEN